MAAMTTSTINTLAEQTLILPALYTNDKSTVTPSSSSGVKFVYKVGRMTKR